MELEEPKIVDEKLKTNAKNSIQRDKINKLFKTMKFMNKMNNLKKEAQKK